MLMSFLVQLEGMKVTHTPMSHGLTSESEPKYGNVRMEMWSSDFISLLYSHFHGEMVTRLYSITLAQIPDQMGNLNMYIHSLTPSHVTTLTPSHRSPLAPISHRRSDHCGLSTCTRTQLKETRQDGDILKRCSAEKSNSIQTYPDSILEYPKISWSILCFLHH